MDSRVRAFVAPRSGPTLDPDHPDAEREDFERLDEGRYRMRFPHLGVDLEVDRLRRKFEELVGELTVRCALPGAQAFGGVLSVADINLSNIRARNERAAYLSDRARTDDLDWLGLLEQFVQRVLDAERRGEPSVLLRDVPRPTTDEFHSVHGLQILKHHPTVTFGDGGSAKSLLALYIAGTLDRAGVRTGLFDWELAAEDHRDRLERLFGSDMPAVHYVRCIRPLSQEVDRLRRIVREEQLGYVILDSVAFACDGPPEAAEVAGRYFGALRRLGIGTLNIAHISKAEGADAKPFGSTFWHNGARSTWFIKLSEGAPESGQVAIGLFNRKANLGALRPPVGFEITFTDNNIAFRRVEVGDTPELADSLSVRQRMFHVLRRGAMSHEELAQRIEAKADTVQRTARRYSKLFKVLPGGLLGLSERT